MPEMNYCPCCETWNRFIPGGRITRPYALCGSCGTFERHRLLYLFMLKTRFLAPGKKLAEFSPNSGLAKAIRLHGVDYHEYSYPDQDLEKLNLPDESFDKTLTVCVLAEVKDDYTAMRELYRITRPGGSGIMHSNMGLPPDTVPPRYTHDSYMSLLQSSGFYAQAHDFAFQLTDNDVQAMNLFREKIYTVRKP